MKLLLKKCDCDWSDLSRIPRSWWMRLFGSRRLYYCSACQSRVFARRSSIEGAAEWRSTSGMLFLPESLPAPTRY